MSARKGKAGNPHPKTRFVKGFDPRRNYAGRPKKGATLAERIREAMEEVIRPEDGYTKMDALIDEAMARAKMGSFQFFDALLSRGYGKVSDRIEISKETGFDASKLTDEELALLKKLLDKARPNAD